MEAIKKIMKNMAMTIMYAFEAIWLSIALWVLTRNGK
jgi:hypothetical protein